MKKKKQFDFWGSIARFILRNRIIILLGVLGTTLFWSSQWKYMQFTYSEANLLPDKHPENLRYQKFLSTFGEEGNLIVIALQDSTFFSPKKLEAWQNFNQKLTAFAEIESVLSVENLKELTKNTPAEKFEFLPILPTGPPNQQQLDQFKQKLFLELPFYKDLLFNPQTETIRSLVYMKKEVVNTVRRKDFIFDELIPAIENFEAANQTDLRVSGMPYVRTLNAQNIVDEIGLFVLFATLLTSLIFFLFFRSFRATFISLLVVLIGVMWAFGVLGFLRYEITVLTALIPPLIIVIGVPNCIFLINKYQLEVAKHGNQAKSLQRVITKIGNATLMTNLTTASGFATFILTNSKILKEFGIVASINIIGIFLLSLFMIPIIYSFLPRPNAKHLKHLKNKWIEQIVKTMESIVRQKKISVYIVSLIGLVLGIIGIYQVNISGSIIEDMPKKSAFFDDILFFEEQFNGIVPLEISIDAQRPKGIYSLSTLRRINNLHKVIEEIPELSSPISVVNGYKYAKQAYYNGNVNYYQLPTVQENRFILPYINNASGDGDLLANYVDTSGQIGRLTTFMRDVPTDRMEEIESELTKAVGKIFPENRYTVELTGKSLLFLKGTHYLIKNLFLSLLLAIVLIALFMAYMFRSFKMIVVSLLPNLLPLIITAGVMGFYRDST